MSAQWTTGLPSAEAVQTHVDQYPVIDSAGRRLGALWIARERENALGFPILHSWRLEVRDGRVMLWNGISFVQPLDEFRWAAACDWRPLDQEGAPVALLRVVKAAGHLLATLNYCNKGMAQRYVGGFLFDDGKSEHANIADLRAALAALEEGEHREG